MNPVFNGNQYEAGTVEYKEFVGQYATSTYGAERDLNPAAILQPFSVEDIQAVVTNAVEQNRPIAIRTGGHQYSGASSCGPGGIQLDLKPTFRRPGIDLNVTRENGKTYLNTSVSWTLKEVYAFLIENGIFMPTGQCVTVCLGGHMQTGGYGMFARSFGLLGDYIRELTVVDYSGKVVTVTKEDHPDFFYGILGGSPGNFGVLTHAKIEVQEDVNHIGSQGLWMAFHYTQERYQAMLDILVEKSEDPSFPRGYDMTVNVMDETVDLASLWPGENEELRKQINDQLRDRDDGSSVGEDFNIHNWAYPLIVVYAQWINIPGEAPFSPDLFKRIKSTPDTWFKIVKSTVDNPQPVSEIASWWLFEKDREYPYPYVKRTNTTKEVDLSKRGWSAWFAKRMTDAIDAKTLLISSQLQVYGGTGSMLQKNAGNGTSYCFRDATLGGTWDVFYKASREPADAWQDLNDAGMEKYFSTTDRRVLWGSYGDWDMKKVWQFYYDEPTYTKLRDIRQKFDPHGSFTANPFCVERATKN
ncbi:FAD-binding protein [Microdochium nivale]|nr:FAD-binding protein [Microdochium nivale]